MEPSIGIRHGGLFMIEGYSIDEGKKSCHLVLVWLLDHRPKGYD